MVYTNIIAMHPLMFKVMNAKFFCNTSSLDYELHSAVGVVYMSYIFNVTEPGVPYNITVRAITAAGLGEPVSIVVFVVQQGNVERVAVDYDCTIIKARCIVDVHLKARYPFSRMCNY